MPIDTTWPAADAPPGLPGPADLLASALAPCLLKNVERASQMPPFWYDSAQVAVQAERQDSPPDGRRHRARRHPERPVIAVIVR